MSFAILGVLAFLGVPVRWATVVCFAALGVAGPALVAYLLHARPAGYKLHGSLELLQVVVHLGFGAAFAWNWWTTGVRNAGGQENQPRGRS